MMTGPEPLNPTEAADQLVKELEDAKVTRATEDLSPGK